MKLTISILTSLFCGAVIIAIYDHLRTRQIDRLVSAAWVMDDGPCYVLANPRVAHVDYWQPRRNGGIAK